MAWERSGAKTVNEPSGILWSGVWMAIFAGVGIYD
jgi:hypothetical protein